MTGRLSGIFSFGGRRRSSNNATWSHSRNTLVANLPLEHDPLAVVEQSGPGLEVVEHILHGLHFGDRMVEFGHRGVAGMHVGVYQAGQDHLAVEVE